MVGFSAEMIEMIENNQEELLRKYSMDSRKNSQRSNISDLENGTLNQERKR